MPYGEDITINVGDTVRIHPDYEYYMFKKLKHDVVYRVDEVDGNRIKSLVGILSGDTIHLNMDKSYFEHAHKEEQMERNYNLEIGDVVLIAEGGWGFVDEDINKYVEVVGFGDYFDEDGVGVKPYECELITLNDQRSLGDVGFVGYESFGENPMILLNTKDQIKEKEVSALDKQVGGGHYKDKGIQPIQYIFANNLGFCEANIVKYASRWKEKGGIQDLEKVIHYAELLIEQARKEGYK